MKALLIEDEEDAREIMAGNLRCYGIETVVESDNFAGAMEILTVEKFDVICIDLKLKDSSGESTLMRLPMVASFAGEAVIVVATGNHSVIPANAKTCADAVLYKPFIYAHFKEALDSAFRRASKPETKRGIFASLEMLFLKTA